MYIGHITSGRCLSGWQHDRTAVLAVVSSRGHVRCAGIDDHWRSTIALGGLIAAEDEKHEME